MKFSVIVPVYNVEAFLPQCLDSIVNQTCQNFEILLIDDGSTDRSGQICDAYARKYPAQVTVFHQANSGCNRARVKGLRRASGEICVFVDADDMLRKDALERIGETFEKNGCDLVLYGASDDENFSHSHKALPFADGQCFEGESKNALYRLMATTGKLNTLWIKAAKKALFDSFLPDYNTSLDIPYGEDLYLSLPLMTCAEKITYLGENLYFYRIREDSAVHSFHPALHRSMKIVRLELERYIAIWGIRDAYPAFYTRVVTDWIRALKSLLKNKASLKREEFLSILQEFSEDSFFRKAYEMQNRGALSRKDRILATLLYRRHLGLLRMIGHGVCGLK